MQTNRPIDGKRLWDSLMSMAQIGATPKGGVRRLALSAVDREGRARFRQWCEALELKVRVDAMGNMFARREGRDPSRLPVMFGSHLDSQPSGGKFDGALGVLAGLEVMRTLNDLNLTTEAPLELVNWTDEEGSRFGHSLMGSGVWSGVYEEDAVKALRDAEGVSVGDALQSIGAAGPEPARAIPADAYFELHIEQGPILERQHKEIGVVTGAQAQVWYEGAIHGRDSHAGTTPPSMRRDALVAMAEVIRLVDRTMRARGEDGRGTVGFLQVIPNSTNVVPGEVRFTAEFRHPDQAEIARIADGFPAEAAALVDATGCRMELREKFRIPAQPFDADCVALVQEAADRLGLSWRPIVSGAGHDAVYVARRVPTAMIFTPCKDGLSHNEEESIMPEEARAGCQVLFEAVVARANRAADGGDLSPSETSTRRMTHRMMDLEEAAKHLSPQFEHIAADGLLALEKLQLPAGAEVLDVGTGVGNFAIFLALRGFDVLTGEPATDTTRYARQNWTARAEAVGVAARIRFQPFNAGAMPFESGRFAAVFFFGVLHHVEEDERYRVFSEALRVVKPGGCVVFFEPTPELLAQIKERDPEHPPAANPDNYKGDTRVRETKLRGRRMDIHVYRAAGG